MYTDPRKSVSIALLALCTWLQAGSAHAVSRIGSQLLQLDDMGLSALSGEFFGSVLASGDFDCDGYVDAVFGVPEDNVLAFGAAEGRLAIVYGSASGLQFGSAVVLVEGTGIDDAPEVDDDFSRAVAVGNFDGNGCDDLAVGVPGENVTFDAIVRPNSGAIHILYGWQFTGGLTVLGSEYLSINDTGFEPAPDNRAGFALAAGDFDGNGRDDLAIGAPTTDTNGVASSGAVSVLLSQPTGFSDSASVPGGGAQLTQNQLFPGTSVPGSLFGSSLAVGDFDGNGVDDLAIGVVGQTVGGASNAGAVIVVYSVLHWGPVVFGQQMWHKDQPGIPGTPGADEYFGSALAAGDFDADGRDDLAIGIPGHHGVAPWAGRVQVLFGSGTGNEEVGAGLTTAGTWRLDSGDVTAYPPSAERIGSALVVGDFDGDERDDLVVGAPDAPVGLVAQGGAAYVLGGQANRTFALRTILDQGVGVPGSPANGEFGLGLGAGDFNADGQDDLLVGNPVYDGSAGAVLYFSSESVFADGFESGGVQAWSSQVGN